MKKIIVTFGLFALTLGAVQAQGRDTSLTKSERQELRKMRKDMNLTEEQKAKLKAIHDQRKATKDQRKAMPKEQRKIENMKTRDSVNSILTDEQEAKRKEIHKKRKEFKTN